MHDYIKKDKKKIKNRFILFVIGILFMIFFIALYQIYQDIDITVDPIQENNYQKMSQTVELVKEESKSIADTIEQVNEAVVGISKVKNTGSTIFLQDGTSKLGLGTGVIVAEDGYILTNEHVSGSKFSTCYVTLDTGKNFTGNVVWSNSDLDLAIVKINMIGLPYAQLGDSNKIRVGETVYAIGNPIGFEFQRTVTSGIISATNRTIKLEENGTQTYMDALIQTDATINPRK